MENIENNYILTEDNIVEVFKKMEPNLLYQGKNQNLVPADKTGAQHYLKWIINDNLSLRYYFYFNDRPIYNNKYVLKTHNEKEYIVIENESIIKELLSINGNRYEEIVGRRISNHNYSKIKINFMEQEALFITEK